MPSVCQHDSILSECSVIPYCSVIHSSRLALFWLHHKPVQPSLSIQADYKITAGHWQLFEQISTLTTDHYVCVDGQQSEWY